ncbi:MAG: hypothetical protein ABR540_11380 [Acidimicrobiales bacterium]
MKLEVLSAQKGDCLLLHNDTDTGPGLILIDGGPAGVSGETLIPRLMELREQRELEDDEPLVIDLVIVSHVDDDHINGVIDLLGAMLERQQGGDPPLFQVNGLWHNSFDRVLGNDETGALLSAVQFGAASMASLVEEAEEGPAADHARVLAGVKQGDDLRRLSDGLQIPVNQQFGGGLIQTAPGEPVAHEVAGVEFVVIGPRQAELVALQKDFDKWLKKQPPSERTGPSMLAALDDESVANLSSIVLLARAGGKTVLLTGDARSDKVLEGMMECGVCGEDETIDVGILKMPHHGSIRNLDDEGDFLGRVTSENYVFSGNGEHGNPDRETLELLFKARPEAEMTLYFTYPVEEMDPVRREIHDRERAKRIKRGKPGGPAWNDRTHSLGALLAGAPPGVKVVQDGIPGI